jgi:hypothetical protein
MDELTLLINACKTHEEYPKNLRYARSTLRRRESLYDAIEERDQADSRLFDDECAASIDLWELWNGKRSQWS